MLKLCKKLIKTPNQLAVLSLFVEIHRLQGRIVREPISHSHVDTRCNRRAALNQQANTGIAEYAH
jgi:hypothetical protein